MEIVGADIRNLLFHFNTIVRAVIYLSRYVPRRREGGGGCCLHEREFAGRFQRRHTVCTSGNEENGKLPRQIAVSCLNN